MSSRFSPVWLGVTSLMVPRMRTSWVLVSHEQVSPKLGDISTPRMLGFGSGPSTGVAGESDDAGAPLAAV